MAWGPLILGVVVVVIYLFVRTLANFGAWMSGARYRAYRQLAARHGGRYETRGLSDPPTVSFNHNGAAVRVGLAPVIAGQPEQIPRTRVVARFGAGIPFRLELAPRARPAPPQAAKGTRARPGRSGGFRPRVRGPGQRRRDGSRLLEPRHSEHDHRLAARGSRRRNARLDQSRADARPDRPQPGHERRRPGLGCSAGHGAA